MSKRCKCQDGREGVSLLTLCTVIGAANLLLQLTRHFGGRNMKGADLLQTNLDRAGIAVTSLSNDVPTLVGSIGEGDVTPQAQAVGALADNLETLAAKARAAITAAQSGTPGTAKPPTQTPPQQGL